MYWHFCENNSKNHLSIVQYGHHATLLLWIPLLCVPPFLFRNQMSLSLLCLFSGSGLNETSFCLLLDLSKRRTSAAQLKVAEGTVVGTVISLQPPPERCLFFMQLPLHTAWAWLPSQTALSMEDSTTALASTNTKNHILHITHNYNNWQEVSLSTTGHTCVPYWYANSMRPKKCKL